MWAEKQDHGQLSQYDLRCQLIDSHPAMNTKTFEDARLRVYCNCFVFANDDNFFMSSCIWPRT